MDKMTLKQTGSTSKLCSAAAVAALVAAFSAVASGGAADGRASFGFESGDLQGWRVVSGAFDRPVSDLAKEHNTGKPYTKEGRWFLTTLETKGVRTDRQTGVIESPLVRLSGPEVSFRVGGGRSCSFELVDRATGKVYASDHGEDIETMFKRKWSVPEAVGRDVFFRVTDDQTGGWGHITVDAISFEGVVGAADFEARAAERAAAEEAKRRKDEEAARNFLAPRVKEVLYVTHAQYAVDHHNTATLFQCGEINERKYSTQGAMKAWNPATGKTRVIVPEKPGRTIRNPDVSYDGRTVVFSMRDGVKDGYHIYTVNADGSNLKQVTFAPGVSDIDPIWLPDGDILFVSTREPKYCMCNRHIMGNLFRMKPNGANIHQIGKSTLFEGHPRVMPDGRILYDRWEYVDRNFGDAQGLWTCNPDGTNHAIYWGNNTTSPGGVIDARALSDPSLCVAVLGSCHDRPWGALGIIDRSKGVDGREPVVWTWPASFRRRIHTDGRDFDSTKGLKFKYSSPYPVDDAHFLCTRTLGGGRDETALCLVGRDGTEAVLLRDAPGIHNPVALAPRAKPPVISTRRNFDGPNAPGYFYLQDVYIGTHMKGVARGSIKQLRIVESPPKRNWTDGAWGGDGQQAPAMNWHSFENKRILGTVPVEPDGSAYFEVPANKFVFFQALDAEGKMVQSMRSGTYVQPGERQGCVGCHENRLESARLLSQETQSAMRRAPSKMNGWHGKTKLFSFTEDVQPVFDRHCVRCHDYGTKGGDKVNLAGDRGLVFNTAYTDLWSQKFVTCAGGGPAEILPAYSWGAHASLLTGTLYGHGRVKMSADERDAVITWMDINAPYYPTYDSAYPEGVAGRGPLTRDEVRKLEALAGCRLGLDFGRRQREQIDFDRPANSRILSAPKAKKNRDAILKIIEVGGERLAKRPRADMPGFKPCGTDAARNARYARNSEWEERVYKAIREGRELLDSERK